jgi:cell division protein FtsB
MTKRMRRLLWTTLGAVTVLVVMAVGVFPTRQYLDQRHQSAEMSSQLRYLQGENAKLAERINSLGTAEAIEQIAREEHGYVRPYEENYVVVVPPGVVARVPSVWPF